MVAVPRLPIRPAFHECFERHTFQRRQVFRQPILSMDALCPASRQAAFQSRSSAVIFPYKLDREGTARQESLAQKECMARLEGLEPPAYRFEVCRSIQLSYRRVL